MRQLIRQFRGLHTRIRLHRLGVHFDDVSIDGRLPVLAVAGHLSLGSRTRFRSLDIRPRIVVDEGSSVVIGDDFFMNEGATIWATTTVTIGNRVRMGNLSCIYDTNAHEVRPGEGVIRGPIVIEDDVWLARGVLVLPGVTIGRASTIGAHAIVTKDVPAGSIVVGPSGKIVDTIADPVSFRRSR